jgi:hypothetical protein
LVMMQRPTEKECPPMISFEFWPQTARFRLLPREGAAHGQ